ncbi:hypothetical protein GGH92_009285, partial [Coemansia sp. RSA 2673]
MFGLSIIRRFSERTLATANVAAGRRLMSNVGDYKVASDSNTATEAPSADETEKRIQFAYGLSSMINNMGSSVEGRSVPVINNSPASAYGRLNRILTENKVRTELRLRHRYEKPKYKRQRLKRESHARLFKEEVRRKVHLIMKMRNW